MNSIMSDEEQSDEVINEREEAIDELLGKMADLEELNIKYCANKTALSIADEARVVIQSTQTFIDNNKELIPGYILKRVTESMNRLQESINEDVKDKLNFKFRTIPPNSKVKPEEVEPALVVGDINELDNPELTEQHLNTEFFGVRDKEEDDFYLYDVDSKDVKLINLKSCKVVIGGLANTVYINNLNDSSVIVCVANRSITVNNCKNCDFHLICQQLRINTTLDCSFNTFVSARAMLESSRNLTFKRINLNNLGFDKARAKKIIKSAKIDDSKNNFENIDDFDWLVPNQKSDNYKIIGEFHIQPE